ncbi:MAG: hypothetical protein U0487_03080 [Patescibacteria group bacterium]
MDGKHFSLITIAMIILLGIVGLGFMQMNTNGSLMMISDRLSVVEKKIDQDPAKALVTPAGDSVQSTTTAYTGWDFAFSYPTAAHTALADNTNVLYITSATGTLFRTSGGPVGPSASEFTVGYEVIIYKADESNLELVSATTTKLSPTKNPLVQKVNFVVDGAGYPGEQYLITTKKGKYLLDANYSDGPTAKIAQQDQAALSTIIESIHE